MSSSDFNAMEAMRYGFSTYGTDSGYCLRFLIAVEAVIFLAAVSVSLSLSALTQLITQLDSLPPDTFWYLFIPTFLIFRCSAQVLINKWLLLLNDGRMISRDEILGFDFAYHLAAIFKMLAASFVYNVFTFIGTLLVFVPGLYAFSTLRFYRFLIIDRDADAVEGLRESYQLCGRSKGQIIVLNVFTLLLKLAGLLCFGVGYFPASAVCGLAEAYAYRKLVLVYEQDLAVASLTGVQLH
jgi:uncharacterized membrane protein